MNTSLALVGHDQAPRSSSKDTRLDKITALVAGSVAVTGDEQALLDEVFEAVWRGVGIGRVLRDAPATP
jgi:hypothetical protein